MNNESPINTVVDILSQIFAEGNQIIARRGQSLETFIKSYITEKGALLLTYDSIEPIVEYENKSKDYAHNFNVFFVDFDDVTAAVKRLIDMANGRAYTTQYNGKSAYMAVAGGQYVEVANEEVFTIGVTLYES